MRIRRFALLLAFVLASCDGPPALSPPPPPALMVAAGDIADCLSQGDEATAALLDRLEGTVALLGDNAYESGTEQEYRDCYHPTWGRHKARTRPSPGNHEYLTPGAAGYFAYFGAAAGDPAEGWYSYELGAWHVVSLNSELPVTPGSPQEQWLRADLAAHPARCVLAYWHRPRFSSARHGNDAGMHPLWQALFDAGADVVLVGHEHVYERLGPQRPDGNPDPARGIRQFTVGTGGRTLYPFGTPVANSEVRYNQTHGVLKLTLEAEAYAWEFIPVSGTFTDTGRATCH